VRQVSPVIATDRAGANTNPAPGRTLPEPVFICQVANAPVLNRLKKSGAKN